VICVETEKSPNTGLAETVAPFDEITLARGDLVLQP
jgi:hypothetical protein